MTSPEIARNRKKLHRAKRAFFGTRSRLAGFFPRAANLRISPEFRGLRWLSAAVIVLFALQAFTGILLALYYYPAPGVAYKSVRFLNEHIPLGWLVRSVHNWCAELLIVALLLHVVVVFFRRGYRYPREYEWVAGVIALPAFLFFRFTGRLLPWDTLGYEATRRGLDFLEAVPLVGGPAASWLRGGEDMGANTLSRFFATHVLILPAIACTLIMAHLLMLRRHGLRGGGS